MKNKLLLAFAAVCAGASAAGAAWADYAVGAVVAVIVCGSAIAGEDPACVGVLESECSKLAKAKFKPEKTRMNRV